MHSPASNTLPRYSQLPVDHYRSHFNTLGLLGIEDRNAHTLTKMDDLVVYVNESIESEGHVQYFSERLALWQLLSTNLKDLIGIIQLAWIEYPEPVLSLSGETRLFHPSFHLAKLIQKMMQSSSYHFRVTASLTGIL